ncbi:hypothetical protein RF683_06110 [Flavobacterium sp. 20NA77.7]|uniref:DUF5723 domain-containing protein n=1 Tax=Flavobacterium nakdongensis TaxID=3073563 RepID=A0ABY9R907_9FLAO|nr:hypothetical protein [Flavobacterium sp. 20NA77.7]WMW77070.1 hypothetical protein RF683_06110 [Flavobacterium sp. 20NA77.7]
MKNIFLKVSLFFIGLQTIQGQDHFLGITTSKRGGLLNATLNPAELSNMNMLIDVNIYNMSLTFSNNKLSFNDLVNGSNLESKFFEGNEPTNARIDGLIIGPGVAFKLGRWSYAVSTQASIKANLIDINTSLGNAIQSGSFTSALPNLVLSKENQRINATTWGELDFSVARKIIELGRHKIAGGATVKVLFPGAYANFGASNFSGTITNVGGNYIVTNANAAINLSYSSILGNDFNNSSNFTNFFNQGINGIAADLGVTYSFKDKDSKNILLHAGLSIKNIGSMNFKTDHNTSIDYTLNISGTQSLNLSQFENINSFQELEQQLATGQNAQLFQKTTSSSAFKVKMPTTVNLYADLKILSKFYITGIVNQKIIDESENTQITTQNTYTLIPRFSIKTFEVFIPLTQNEISKFTTGIGIRVGGFYIGSNSIISTAMNNSKQADAYFGFRFGI